MTTSTKIVGGTACSWTTDRAGGFTSAELITIEPYQRALSQVLELRALHAIALNLLDIYVGHRAGERV